MTQYTIKYNGWESQIEYIGEDFVYFSCTGYSDDNSNFSFPLCLPFKYVIKYAQQEMPFLNDILEIARKHIKGWGPHESTLVRELEECGIDLEQMVVKAIKHCFDLEEEARKYANIRANPEVITKMLEDMLESLSEVKTETVNYYQLCDHIEKVITDVVVNKFPVILNSSPECINNLHSVLVRRIPDLANDLTTLIRKAEAEK